MDREYNYAVAELLDLLRNTEDELINKVPTNLIDIWEKQVPEDYKSKGMLTEEDWENIELAQKTKALIGMVYRNYWCNAEERKMYDEILRKNEEKRQAELKEKYKEEDLYRPVHQEEATVDEENEMIVYKDNIIIRIINKIKEMFNIL
jgi:hypothetical protein